MLVLARFRGRADPAVAHPRLGANQPVVARRVRNELNVAFWLQAEVGTMLPARLLYPPNQPKELARIIEGQRPRIPR